MKQAVPLTAKDKTVACFCVKLYWNLSVIFVSNSIGSFFSHLHPNAELHRTCAQKSGMHFYICKADGVTFRLCVLRFWPSGGSFSLDSSQMSEKFQEKLDSCFR